MIRVKNLTKDYQVAIQNPGFLGFLNGMISPKYRAIPAIQEVSFDVKRGEMSGIVGLNGAGKSTLIKMLTGVTTPTSGELMVNGLNPSRQRLEYVKRIGVVFGQRSQLLWDLPVEPSFRMLKEIYQIPKERFEENLSYYTKIFGVDEFIATPLRMLSLGQRMRAEIVASLLHDPDILFLDEPTIGLDVLVKKKIRTALLEMNRSRNTTVILTSHDLDDIDQLCNRLLILDAGTVKYDGSKDGFIEKYRSNKKITFVLQDDCVAEAFHAHPMLSGIDGVHWNGNSVVIPVEREGDQVARLIQKLIGELPTKDVSIDDNSLEDIVAEFYD